MMTTATDQLTADLRQAHRNVLQLRSALDAAAANMARADEIENAAREALALLEVERSQLVAAAGDQLAARIRAGKPDDFTITSNLIDGKITAAATHLAITSAAAVQIRSTHEAALNALHRAETERGKLADAVMLEEVERLAVKFEQQFAEACATGEELRKLAGKGLDIPIHVSKRVFTDRVQGALRRLPERDNLNTPVNELRGGFDNIDHWSARRTALINQLEEA
jgi:hypothetical protein